MRFKQTKPQHVKKKDEEGGCHGNQGREVSVPAECTILTVPLVGNDTSLPTVGKRMSLPAALTDTDGDGCDSVDGDMEAANFKLKSPGCGAPTEANGHDTVMDLKPMLELYTKEECAESLTWQELDDPPTPVVTENDVIIQGRRPIFSESEESNIATQLKQWKEQGMKYTRLDVVKMASEYAVHLGKRPQGRPLTVKWFRSFLTRHPECYIRKSRKAKTERPEKQYFNQLDMILTTYNMKESPHCIFSLVEVPLPMLKGGDLSVAEDLSINGAGMNGNKPHRKLTFMGKVPSSVLFCGSAAGQALPPFLVFTGKSLDKCVMSGITPGASGIASSSGRATSEVLISFLREHFLSQAPGRAGDTLVLLLDANLGRCLNQAVIDLGSAFKVVFVTAQTTLNPQLHPMAVGCCNTFQRELCYELQKPHYTSESAAISSSSICEFLCRLYHRNMAAENLHSTFRKAGIFPFNPSICRKRYGSATVRTAINSGQPSKYSNPASSHPSPQLRNCDDDDEMEGNQVDGDLQ